MWTRNNDVSNRNMLKHFIYSSFSKSTTSFLCSLYYKYSSKLSSFFCILSFLVIATSIDQTFYSATHYLAAVWLDSRHDLNNKTCRQTEQAKTSQSLSTSESTSSSDTARLEADKARRQAEATKAFFDEINLKKTLNQDTAHIKANKEKDRAEESSKTASSESFNIFINKLEEFVENTYEDEDQNDKSDCMKIEQSEASKSDDLRQQIYEKVTSLLRACSVFYWNMCSLSESKTLSSLALFFSLYI